MEQQTAVGVYYKMQVSRLTRQANQHLPCIDQESIGGTSHQRNLSSVAVSTSCAIAAASAA